MKDILVLLVLLNALAAKVWSLPYTADSNGSCNLNEYVPEGSQLCCKKCPPGHRLIKTCSETTETECELCSDGLYIEGWNYSPNCFSCNKCKARNGVQYAQNCSSSVNSYCECRPGMFCLTDYDRTNGHCSACVKYSECKPGYGVSVPGKANSNVRCVKCPEGTFSEKASYTDPCRPHTNCHGRAVVQKGNALSDTVCELEASTQPQTSTSESAYTTASPGMSTFSTTSDSMYSPGRISATPNTTSTETSNNLVVTIASVVGISLILFLIIIGLLLCKATWKKDTARLPTKVDANGNCKSIDEINQSYLGQTQLTSFTATSPDQQCLLEKVETSNDFSQCSSNTDTLTRTDGCSSHESISPLQSTLALDNPALSEPMTLMSNTESFTPQPSITTESSFQPTSPQIISPVSPSPQVNVNITFHIGNGSTGTPPVMPTDSCIMQTDSKLPFGEEEECSSIPQQEAGKQSLISVEESTSYST